MKYILNLTGVPATPEQVFDGVIELVNSELKERLVNALSFDKVPLFKEVEERAELIEDIFVEDTEIRTGLKLKEISKNSGKEIPLWSKLKEMDIGVMLNTDTFMVSILDEVLSNSAKVMYSVFKTEPIFANITKDGRDIIQPSIFRGDNIFIDARKSIIKINNVSYDIEIIGDASSHTGIDLDGDLIEIILSDSISKRYAFKKASPSVSHTSITTLPKTFPYLVMTAGEFKLITPKPQVNIQKGPIHIGFYCRDNDVETVEIYSGDVIYIDVVNSVIKVNDEMYNISMIGNSAQDTNLAVNGDKIIITGCHINNVYEFKRDLPLRAARDALKPSFFRKAGRFKIIGRVNND